VRVDYWRDLRAAFGPGPLIAVGAGVIMRQELFEDRFLRFSEVGSEDTE
jgi:hypothetical protein